MPSDIMSNNPIFNQCPLQLFNVVIIGYDHTTACSIYSFPKVKTYRYIASAR